MMKEISELIAQAAAGDVVAQYRVGNLHREGLCVARDQELAIKYWQQAAEQNYPPALDHIGISYEWGFGVSQDIVKAVAFYVKAAELYYPPSIVRLGKCLLEGRGVETNFPAAFYMFQEAANPRNLNGHLMPLSSANFDRSEAQFYLAECYRDGKGTTADTKAAIDLLREAASPERFTPHSSIHDKACLQLAALYERNIGFDEGATFANAFTLYGKIMLTRTASAEVKAAAKTARRRLKHHAKKITDGVRFPDRSIMPLDAWNRYSL